MTSIPQIQDVCTVIEQYAPLALQESYDNSGLLVGDARQDLKGILITLDVNEATLDEAIAKNLNLIVAHHPVIFRALKTLTGQTLTERCVIKAIKHNICIYAAHTNLDSVGNGVSAALAQQLNLKECTVLAPKPNVSPLFNGLEVGYGIVGYLEESLSEQEFLEWIKNKLQLEVIKHSAFQGKRIHKVALSGGSGSSLIPQAHQIQADAYLSAEFKYHDFHDYSEQLFLTDIGHFESEQFTKQLFCEILTEKFSKFAHCFAETSVNPVKYYK